MPPRDQLREIKLKTAEERCHALSLAVESFERLLDASEGRGSVLAGVKLALDELRKYLQSLKSDTGLTDLADDELETKIHFKTRIIPYLHEILGLVEHSDVASVPAELITPIGRKLKQLFPKARIMVVSSSELNYSFIEIVQFFQGVWNVLECARPKGFPEKIFRISVPAVEDDQVLLHCMLGHEIGHPLYTTNHVESKLLPVELDQATVSNLAKRIKTQLESSDPADSTFGELALKTMITSRVHSVVSRWIEELGADLFALSIFGPSFLLAFIHFVSGFLLLDDASDTFRIKDHRAQNRSLRRARFGHAAQ
jgi:hypothetical protein